MRYQQDGWKAEPVAPMSGEDKKIAQKDVKKALVKGGHHDLMGKPGRGLTRSVALRMKYVPGTYRAQAPRFVSTHRSGVSVKRKAEGSARHARRR